MKINAALVALTLVATSPVLAQSAAPSSPTTSAAPAARTKREPTAGQMAARDRQKKCGAEWKAAKASNSTGGDRWPQFWSKCNARLKGNQA